MVRVELFRELLVPSRSGDGLLPIRCAREMSSLLAMQQRFFFVFIKVWGSFGALLLIVHAGAHFSVGCLAPCYAAV